MAWKSLVDGLEIEDVRGDRRRSESIEKYNVSSRAVYFEGKYLPVSRIQSLCIHPSVYRPRSCCGRGVPVFKVKIEHGEEKPLILMLEREKNANRMVEAIIAANPGVRMEEYVDPSTGEKPGRIQSGVM